MREAWRTHSDGMIRHAADGAGMSAGRLVAADAPRTLTIDTGSMPYRVLNTQIRAITENLAPGSTIDLRGIMGQRYIGTSLEKQIRIVINGIPGNDLGAFMDGPEIEVCGDAQDGCGNTMNDGLIVVHGSAGDILGHSMRGGKILVRDNVGYRVGIHMKEYAPTGVLAQRPIIVIGGTAQHFLGEYMAGGILVVLGRQLGTDQLHPSHFVGTGMHGGVIFVRGRVKTEFLGKEVGVVDTTPEDQWMLQRLIAEWASRFGIDPDPLLAGNFTKLVPLSARPYGKLYAY